jgi:hypothetical protein
MEAGEWLSYTVQVAKAGAYAVQLRAANGEPTAAQVLLKIDGKPMATMPLPSASGEAAWQTVGAVTPPLSAGKHTVQLYVEQAPTALAWLRFEPAGPPAKAGDKRGL